MESITQLLETLILNVPSVPNRESLPERRRTQREDKLKCALLICTWRSLSGVLSLGEISFSRIFCWISKLLDNCSCFGRSNMLSLFGDFWVQTSCDEFDYEVVKITAWNVLAVCAGSLNNQTPAGSQFEFSAKCIFTRNECAVHRRTWQSINWP